MTPRLLRDNLSAEEMSLVRLAFSSRRLWLEQILKGKVSERDREYCQDGIKLALEFEAKYL